MKRLLIVNVGSASTLLVEKYGNFEHWAKSAVGETKLVVEFHDGIHKPLPPLNSLAGVIIMGSPAMVTQQLPWMKKLEVDVLRLAENSIPTLGICFGHQLIAKAFGGDVAENPKGLEIGTVTVKRTCESHTDPIFSTLPMQFDAHTIHFQSVVSAPDNATILASNDMESHHAFRIGETTWGVQFHPEFSTDVMRTILHDNRQHLSQSELEQRLNRTTDTVNAQSILPKFNQLVLKSIY
ncbi:glutamine amidotransferase [Vibrio caribbeanicus]|uniref:glutamine amidotransferase n=1 Tax=Vibrio caribbeanicus TaxID=701175 RepID=UPI0030D77FFB